MNDIIVDYLNWNDNSGNKIRLDYTSGAGTNSMSISSDANNTGVERTRTISFKNNGVLLNTLLVKQLAFSNTLSYYGLHYNNNEYNVFQT